jgi:transcriptional regulator with XRE-family HTH domain
MTLEEATKLRIFDLCVKNNITINKLGTICGITQSTLNNIVNGGSKNPSITTIKKICDGLNITLHEFFDTQIFNELEQELK